MTDRRNFIKTTAFGAIGIGIIHTLPGCKETATATSPPAFTTLPRSTPEAQGISSAVIQNFLRAAEKSGQEFHGFMIVKNEHVVSEGWWSPFAPELKHTLYSLSKSFTSTAVGMCVADGLLTVESPVLSFFPEYAPAKVSDNLAAMKVKHLLTMNTGHDEKPMGAMQKAEDGKWSRVFFETEIVHEPGSHFLYNTGATYILAAIVQKLVGRTVHDFLSERLFKPLNMEGADWEISPEGVTVAGYGLRIRTEDIAKLGQLYLLKGEWNGEQLLPAEWVEEATKKQTESQTGDNDWAQGYGYQFWRCKPAPGFYRGDGAFGQYCIVIPQYNTVIAINSESPDMQATMNVVWDSLLPGLQNEGALEADEATQKSLAADLEKLALPPLELTSEGPLASQITGKQFKLGENERGAESITFNFENNICKVSLKGGEKNQTITCGMGQWLTEGNDQGIVYSLFVIPERMGVISKVAACAAWQDDHTLLIKMKYIENIHGDLWTCHFQDDKVTVSFLNSVAAMGNEQDNRAALTGQLG